jgi:UbiD family decarboxylase
MVNDAPAYYRDLREHIQALRDHDLLVEIDHPVNKDTELHPLVRLQFRGLPESERKAFLFTNVVDSSGRRYGFPVAVGLVAASRRIYALGMQCSPEEISDRWRFAQSNPVAPVVVENAPVHEVVLEGDALRASGGLGALPVPISTPGFDNAPYTTASHWVTRDPDSGLYNVGNYRGQVKSEDRLGCFTAAAHQHLKLHWQKYRDRGEPMPVAVVIGVPPSISYTAVSKIPKDVEEYAVAGGLAQHPVELVRCRTNDLLVPANAEIVIEGVIPTDQLEPEGPFGEFPGYVAKGALASYMDVTCITHRRDAVYVSFISQFPPSESSMLRKVGRESILRKQLTVDAGFSNVTDVAIHESAASWGLIVIQVAKPTPGQGPAMLAAFLEKMEQFGKMLVVVDDDIDPHDAESVNWAIAFRMQPGRDTQVVPIVEQPIDPSVASPADGDARAFGTDAPSRSQLLFIDATRKWPYPPTSLPRQEHMEQAVALWSSLGLPELKLRRPWFGTDLGFWPADHEQMAELAVQGRHFETGAADARARTTV